MNQEQAQNRIDELKGYYAHLGSYVGGCIFFVTLNMMDYGEGGEVWFVYPLLGWGIGLLAHTFSTFAGGKDWEKRKMQELTGWSSTQDELEKLSERTDALISILSNVDWEKIDPDLLASKENLLKAQARIKTLKGQQNNTRVGTSSHDEHSETSKAEVIQELERLEKFVTSSKFNYYEQAAKP